MSSDEFSSALNVVVIGSKDVGKTSLLLSYCHQSFPRESPKKTIYDCYSVIVDTDDTNTLTLKLHDTPGGGKFEALTHFVCQDIDIGLICYSVDSKSSFESIRRFVVDFCQRLPKTPWILVALKSDLRQKSKQNVISTNKGKLFAEDMTSQGCLSYMECSSKEFHDDNSINTLFEVVISEALSSRNTRINTLIKESMKKLNRYRIQSGGHRNKSPRDLRSNQDSCCLLQ